jgi:hypothetical protein
VYCCNYKSGFQYIDPKIFVLKNRFRNISEGKNNILRRKKNHMVKREIFDVNSFSGPVTTNPIWFELYWATRKIQLSYSCLARKEKEKGK